MIIILLNFSVTNYPANFPASPYWGYITDDLKICFYGISGGVTQYLYNTSFGSSSFSATNLPIDVYNFNSGRVGKRIWVVGETTGGKLLCVYFKLLRANWFVHELFNEFV